MIDLKPLLKNELLISIREREISPSSLALDSRKIEKGGIFIAIPGTHYDGTKFIEEALQRGAEGIIVPQGMGKQIAEKFKDKYPRVSFFETPNVRKTASLLASHFYPLQPDTVVAVTGTNGKTSVASFMRQLWHQLAKPAASLGTLGLVVEGRPLPSPTGTEGINTPPAVILHQILQTLKKEGIENLAFEASSHALDQHRLDAVHLKAAVFTNFSNDHLDYHITMEAYLEAKIRLFTEILEQNASAVLNTDIPEYKKILKLCEKQDLNVVTFGKQGNLLRPISITPQEESQEVVLECKGKRHTLSLPLVGQFQIYNIMAAASAVIACGGDEDRTLEACAHLQGVPGRLERIIPGVYVDYAHTPDGLLSSLTALRPHTKGKLWVVFGCGGNRDTIKRSAMGGIAAQLADKVIVTDDNPRHEDPAEIRKQVLTACPHAQEIGSRAEAIRAALDGKQPGDIVLIAGKGHEPYQIIGEDILPFDDGEEVRQWANL